MAEISVIARNALGNLVLWLIILGISSGLLFWLGLMEPRDWRNIVLLVGAPLPLLAAAFLIWPRFREGDRAIWIAGENLHMGARQAPLNSIQDVFFHDFRGYFGFVYATTIAVRSRNGDVVLYSAPVSGFTETSDVVLARLRDALGLPEA